MDKLKITMLSDNFSSTIVPPLLGEWGFSALIEYDGVRVLFDVGNSGIPVYENSKTLGLDLSQVDYIVLSHGHRDHTGGFGNRKLLEKMKGKTLVAHPGIFEKKFLNWSGKLQDITIPISREIAERDFGLILSKGPVKLTERITFSGEIKRYGFPQYTGGLFRLEDMVVPDEVKDDASLYIETEKGLVVLTGCGHAGVLNIMEHSREISKDSIYAVLGGFHLLASPREHVDEVSNQLANSAQVIGPAHCSGNRIKSLMQDKGKYVDMGVGKVFNLD